MTQPTPKNCVEVRPDPCQRDVRLDALRGFLLILMTIDHLPMLLATYTYEFAGYVSAAEGFVFLSGFVGGLTYKRTYLQNGTAGMWRRASRKIGYIYMYHILTFSILYFTLRARIQEGVLLDSWLQLFGFPVWQALLMGATLVYQPDFLDILPMYCIFVIATPWIIQQFENNKGILVLSGTFFLWLLAQDTNYRPVALIQQHLPVFLGNFDLFAWQSLFVGGLYLGFRSSITWLDLPPARPLLYCCLFSATAFFLFHHHLVSTEMSKYVDIVTDKRTLGPLRLLNFATIAFLVNFGLKWLKGGRFVGLLGYLGRSSLLVFSFHTVLILHLQGFVGRANHLPQITQIILAILAVVSLYGIVWFFQRVKGLLARLSLEKGKETP